MAKKKKENVLGAWAFLIGVVLAIIVGLVGAWEVSGNVAMTLVILGIIIGLLNVSGKETKDFLMAGAVLVIVSALAGDVISSAGVGVPMVAEMFNGLVLLFVPATIVVALKAVFSIAKK